MQRVYDFAESFYADAGRAERMVDAAKKHLSWERKMGEVFDFIERKRELGIGNWDLGMERVLAQKVS